MFKNMFGNNNFMNRFNTMSGNNNNFMNMFSTLPQDANRQGMPSWWPAAQATTSVPAGRLGVTNPMYNNQGITTQSGNMNTIPGSQLSAGAGASYPMTASTVGSSPTMSASPSTSSSAGGSFNKWLSGGGAGAIAGTLGSLFGGNAYDTVAKGYEQIPAELQQYLQQALGYLSPYQQAGTSALGEYSNKISQMNDPVGFYNKIMDTYSTSPALKFQQQQGLEALKNNAAATGYTGSGQQLKDVMGYSQGLAQQGQQDYLNNVLGINTQALGGLSNISGMGEQAGSQMGDWTQQTGENIAAMMSQIAQAKGQAQSSKSSGWGNLLGLGLDAAGYAGLF